MKISDYRTTATSYLKGHYGEAFIVTTLCLFVFAVLKATFLMILYVVGNFPYTNVIESAGNVLCFLVMTPLMTGGFWWFFQSVCDGDNRNLLKLYSGLRLNSRAALLYALMWFKSFASLLPTAIFWTVSYVFFYGKTGFSAEITLFVAFQSFVMGIIFISLYFSTLASMALAPFMFISHPDRNPFGVIRDSTRLMRGRKRNFLKLILSFIPSMLPIVTIPFVMPSVAMSVAVFARDSIMINERGKV